MVYAFTTVSSAGKQFVGLFIQSLPRAILLQHFSQGTEEMETMIVVSYAIILAVNKGPTTAVGTMLAYSTDALGPVAISSIVCVMAGLVFTLTLVPFLWKSLRLALVDDLNKKSTSGTTGPVIPLANMSEASEKQVSPTWPLGSSKDEPDIIDEVL